ncbi:putative transcriptional regulator, Crp/Fnr family [Emticicia oligotrophica DSM 17448]|uniref:Transcriptional regulator, Crp/Fnr family n=1 Tax=Emticicia oligotrophica (strain DSM 17448 / CIP 109782 / MTCC 6937 / GPTSA100-15) TaxID=929562 RepID=A0ABN4ARL8_EMTOG|nr:Crp/Fnr family transcriptional regulator [Emticicia oligotrophica]AFK03976.1 putative transcriptional regulator, Crp/Fnr family [Emticicia oligotrophica DSM 17448]
METPIKLYLESYQQICKEINDEELSFIEEHLSISEIKAKHYYLKAGQIQKSIGYVIEGLIRSYYIDEKGDEITVGFIKENEYATDYGAFIRQKPSKYYFKCIEPSIVVNLPYTTMQEGYKKYKSIERYGRLVTEEVLILQQTRIESFLFENAEERYLNFIKRSPNLFNRISLTYLSSYLGIERQSLSRIRKMLISK